MILKCYGYCYVLTTPNTDISKVFQSDYDDNSPDYASRTLLTPVKVGGVVVGPSVTRPTH